MDISEIRRHNARLLAGQCPTLLVFGERINRSSAQVAHWIGKNASRNIGPTIARIIEEAFDKPSGWLDIWHMDAGDERFPHEEIQRALQSIDEKTAEGSVRAHRLAGFIINQWEKGLLSDRELTLMETMMDAMLPFTELSDEEESARYAADDFTKRRQGKEKKRS